MNKTEIEQYKKKLLEEQATLQAEIEEIGSKDNTNPSGWDASAKDIEVDSADENEVADKIEEMEDNAGIIAKLETQLNDVKSALEKISNGTYGTCEACNKPIEKERLDANPSAKVSLKHSHK